MRSPEDLRHCKHYRFLTQDSGVFAETDYPSGPKTAAVADILEAIKEERFTDDREQHVEKAFKSHMTTINPEEFFNTLKACWKAKYVAGGLAVACGLSLGATTLLRGNNQQLLELSDLWPTDYEETDYIVCHAVVKQGKTLGVGHVQHAACIRHQDPHRCPIGHIAWVLLHRWHKTGRSYPNFWSRAAWYDKKLLCQKNNEVSKFPSPPSCIL